MNANKLLIVVGVGLLLAGCGGSDTLPTDFSGGSNSGGVAGGSNAGGSGVTTSGVDSGAGGRFGPFVGEQPGDRELLNDVIIYFEFDSSEIRSDFNAMLAAHGRYLAATPSASVRLEGHADERGSIGLVVNGVGAQSGYGSQYTYGAYRAAYSYNGYGYGYGYGYGAGK